MVAAVNSPAPVAALRDLASWILGAAIITAIGALAAAKPTLLLNRSPSEPPGLYVRAGRDLGVGSIIAFRTPSAAFPYADLAWPICIIGPCLRRSPRDRATGFARLTVS